MLAEQSDGQILRCGNFLLLLISLVELYSFVAAFLPRAIAMALVPALLAINITIAANALYFAVFIAYAAP